MAVTDLADIATTASAGYSEVVLDRGASSNPAVRWEVTLSKSITGGGGSGGQQRAFAQADTQANAETLALARLNGLRRHRYGGSSGRASGDANSPDARGATLTPDQS